MQVKNVAAAIIDAGANTAVHFFGDGRVNLTLAAVSR